MFILRYSLGGPVGPKPINSRISRLEKPIKTKNGGLSGFKVVYRFIQPGFGFIDPKLTLD